MEHLLWELDTPLTLESTRNGRKLNSIVLRNFIMVVPQEFSWCLWMQTKMEEALLTPSLLQQDSVWLHYRDGKSHIEVERGAGEIVQWLRACIVLAQEPS